MATRAEPRARRGTAGETRQRIVDALVELLADHAIWEITITMLTRRVGVTSQLFYRHFSGLDDVLAAHCEAIMADVPDVAPLLAGDWPDEQAFERMRRVSEVNLAFWNTHRDAMRVLGMLDDLRKPRFARFREMRGSRMAEAFAGLARRQQAHGRLPAGMCDRLIGWNCTSRLQAFGLSFPEVIAQGHTSDDAIATNAAMLAMSLGFAVTTQQSKGNEDE